MNAIVKGFDHQVHDAQTCFRHILKALSEPGKRVQLDKHNGFPPLNAATSQIIMSLCDQQTGIYISPELEGAEENLANSLQNLAFHNGVSKHPEEEADFAVISAHQPINFNVYNVGTDASPDESTTVIVQTDSLCDGPFYQISGPGIQHPIKIQLGQLSNDLQAYLLHPSHPYPLGLDFMFCVGNEMVAISRTTKVELI